MNRIEANARPYLTPLVEGRPVTLFPEAVEAIAKWIALKAIICEHMHQDEYVTTREDRIAFAKTRVIPPYFRIQVGYHLDSAWGGTVYKHCGNLRRSDVAADGLTPRTIQLFTIGIGTFFVNLIASRQVEAEEIFVHNDNGMFPAIFPFVPDRQLRWPPLGPMTPVEMERIATALEKVFREDRRILNGDLVQFGKP